MVELGVSWSFCHTTGCPQRCSRIQSPLFKIPRISGRSCHMLPGHRTHRSSHDTECTGAPDAASSRPDHPQILSISRVNGASGVLSTSTFSSPSVLRLATRSGRRTSSPTESHRGQAFKPFVADLHRLSCRILVPDILPVEHLGVVRTLVPDG